MRIRHLAAIVGFVLTASIAVAAEPPWIAPGLVQSGPSTSRPSQAQDGRLYQDTDVNRQLRWDAGAGAWSQSDGALAPSLQSSLSAYASVVDNTNGILAHWRLGEASGTTFADSIGAHTATITSGVTLNQDGLISLDSGKSALFASAKVAVGLTDSAATFPFGEATPFTVEAVVNPNVTRSGAATYYTIVSKEQPSSPFYGWTVTLRWDGTSKTDVRFQMANSTGSITAASSGVDISNGSPHHIIVSYDGGGRDAYHDATYTNIPIGVKMWIDGQAIYVTGTSTNLSGTTGANVNVPLSIGGRFDGTTLIQPFSGNMQDISVYGRALRSWEATAHYRALVRRSVLMPSQPSGRPHIILDTDNDSDVGDPAAIAYAMALHNEGLIDLIGITTINSNDTSAPMVKIMANYSGLPSLPIGAYQGSDFRNTPARFTDAVVSRFNPGDTRANYPAALTTLRTLLANSPDPITIVEIGPAKNLADLIASPADSISPLTGAQLVAAKVDRVVFMGGLFPAGNGATSPEFNMGLNSTFIAANQAFLASWPTKVIFIGGEEGWSVQTGPRAGSDGNTDPLKYSFQLVGTTLRSSWDAMAIQYAAVGVGAQALYVFGGADGTVTLSANGNSYWSAAAGKHSFIKKSAPDATIAASIQNVLNTWGYIPR